MNKNEINKIMELKNKIKDLNEKIIELNLFFRTYSNSFSNEDSIEALKKIKNYLNHMIKTRISYEESIQNISMLFDCHHKIIISDVLEYVCPICKRRFKYDDVSNSSKYLVNSYYDYDKDENEINNIIIEAYDEEDACEDILSFLCKKQTESNIEIKRLLK